MKSQMKAKYLGGHPARGGATACTLTIDDQGVRARVIRPFLDLDWAEVREVSVEGPDQVERRVTVTRLLTTGIFAFALKKKGKRAAYVTVGTDDGEAIFEVEAEPMQLRASLGWTRARCTPA